jgi:hypothetical protein
MDKLPNPFLPHPEYRFVLDAARFIADLDESPKFLVSPTREFLIGCGLAPVLEILDAH